MGLMPSARTPTVVVCMPPDSPRGEHTRFPSVHERFRCEQPAAAESRSQVEDTFFRKRLVLRGAKLERDGRLAGHRRAVVLGGAEARAAGGHQGRFFQSVFEMGHWTSPPSVR